MSRKSAHPQMAIVGVRIDCRKLHGERQRGKAEQDSQQQTEVGVQDKIFVRLNAHSQGPESTLNSAHGRPCVKNHGNILSGDHKKHQKAEGEEWPSPVVSWERAYGQVHMAL